MKIMVLGGDGFCGWASSLRLSRLGHDVIIVDNLSRRQIDEELGIRSLTPISSIEVRLEAWRELRNEQLHFCNLDVARDYEGLAALIREQQPDCVVHFATQRAAPYSMRSPQHKCYTVDNNVNATHNLLAALAEHSPATHLVHLGSMGVYGYGASGVSVPEGYLTVQVPTRNGSREMEILYPGRPGSVYHMTKVLDQTMFEYYNRNDGIRVTDLHQGIVWGTQTEETELDLRLVNRFDYDGDFGTVLNRFLVQAAIGHPLTVHGTGGQKRAFIHITDSVRCIQLAAEHPPAPGDRVRIFNQMTEVHAVRQPAELVSQISSAPVEYVPNPRNEAPENELSAENVSLLDLGLRPTLLQDRLLEDVMKVAGLYAENCDRTKIPSQPVWNKRIRELLT